jgi:phosphatidylinositol alpha-1,6-mannosyltransferase
MTRGRRVLLIANNFPPVLGGSASVYANLARCRPDKILVLAPARNYLTGERLEGWPEYDSTAAFRIRRLPLLRTVLRTRTEAGLSNLTFMVGDLFIRMRVLIEVLRYIVFCQVRSVCIGELLASAWLVSVLRFVPGIHVTVYIHGEEITTEDSYDPRHERARQTLGMAQSIVVVSRFTLGAVEKLLGSDHAGQISLIENGVDTELFTAGPKSEALVSEYGLDGKFIFITVCRLLQKKGVDVAIRALPALIARFPDTRYVVVGDGEFGPHLQQLAAELQLTEHVVFTGRVTEEKLQDHYRLGDVFVMPNRRLANGDTEGFGLVFLEANSCGIPVIAGKDGGSPDAVTDGVNGLVVDGNSVEEVARAMIALREDEELRARIITGARARASRSDWHEKAESLIALSDEMDSVPIHEDMQSWGQILAVASCSIVILLLAAPYILLIRIAEWLPARYSQKHV